MERSVTRTSLSDTVLHINITQITVIKILIYIIGNKIKISHLKKMFQGIFT